jgi:hypothetical protein
MLSLWNLVDVPGAQAGGGRVDRDKSGESLEGRRSGAVGMYHDR